jgi:predicted dienelactone hydrolase
MRIVAFIPVVLLACPPAVFEPVDSLEPGETGDTGSPPTETGDTGRDTAETGSGLTAPDYGTVGCWSVGATTSVAENANGDTLPVELWYPSSDGDGEPHVYGWESWYFTGQARADVEPDCSQPRPVMVHSHGNSSIRFEMFWMMEFAASHGWIVVAPDHPGNTFLNSSADFASLLTQRPADLQATFDWLLTQSADPHSAVYGCVDPDAGYTVTGYSFGGYTAYATGGAELEGGGPALSDDRVQAVVTHAPWDAYEAIVTGTGAIDVPVLTMGGERDATVGTDYATLHSSVTSRPRALGSFANAGHYSFTPIYCTGDGDGCGDGFVDSDVLTGAVGTAVMAFLGHLRGEEGAIEQLPEVASELSWELVLE